GNTELSAIVSWDKFNSMVLANEEKIKENTDQAKFVFSHAGGRSVSTLEALTKICEDDPDYKAEIATITSIVFEPKEDYDEADSTFSLSNTTLTVLSGHKYQRSYDDFIKPLKALF
ncbi:hypothetical protein JYU18_01530, partial [bacterium AH-315-E07]|nr:hypothetical protein [bacterium AH-315-E07]